MPSVGFEPVTPAIKRPQTYVWDRTATGIGMEQPTLTGSSLSVLIPPLNGSIYTVLFKPLTAGILLSRQRFSGIPPTHIVCNILFWCGVSELFRVMASSFGASRSHSLDTRHSVGLLWTSDQSGAEISGLKHITLTRDKHPCLPRDSNPQFHQASGRRPTP